MITRVLDTHIKININKRNELLYEKEFIFSKYM